MGTKISIKDLAKECGCSTATVSNVLNGKGFFSKETRERVLKVARKHNYTPNPSARSLRRGKTELVGVVFYRPNADIFSSEFYLTLMRGFQKKLSELGYDMILSEYTDTMLEQDALPPFILRGKADAVVILGGFPERALKTLTSQNIPLVMLDTFHEKYDSITTDGFNATEQAMQELAKLGHKKVAYFGYITEDYNTDMREKGFLSGLHKFGFDNRNSIIYRNFKTNSEAIAEFEKLMTSKDRVSAVLASNDNLAQALLEKAKAMKIKVPTQLNIIGFDDSPIALRCSPTLSTIHTDTETLGEMGATAILKRIENPNAPIEHKLLRSTPIMRETTSAIE